jgi:hypothetical protein
MAARKAILREKRRIGGGLAATRPASPLGVAVGGESHFIGILRELQSHRIRRPRPRMVYQPPFSIII